MGSISDYLENKLLDHVLGTAAYSPPATVYIGLSTANPLDDASGLAEPSGGGYARKAVTFGAAASRAVSNSAQVDFDQATASWGTITYYAIFDAASGGNMLAHGSLATAKEVVSGNTPYVAVGEVEISVNAGDISDYLANALLDFAFRNQAYSQPTIYVGLTTAAITDSDTGSTITEVSGGSYARTAHSAWTAASGGAADNDGSITFPDATASWGTITDAFLADAATAGNILLYSADIVDQEPTSGDTVQFATGDLDVTID
jgi:hypothetical protein